MCNSWTTACRKPLKCTLAHLVFLYNERFSRHAPDESTSLLQRAFPQRSGNTAWRRQPEDERQRVGSLCSPASGGAAACSVVGAETPSWIRTRHRSSLQICFILSFASCILATFFFFFPLHNLTVTAEALPISGACTGVKTVQGIKIEAICSFHFLSSRHFWRSFPIC